MTLRLALALACSLGAANVASASANAGEAIPGNADRPAIYQRVDSSFSSIAIDTPFALVADRLTQIRAEGCETDGECDYRDADGVRHYFWEDNGGVLVIKLVIASEMQNRPISALGIGTARRKAEVMENVRAYLPGIALDCDPARVSRNVGPDECSASVGEGWFQIGFDKQGYLQAVRFDGYQFT